MNVYICVYFVAFIFNNDQSTRQLENRLEFLHTLFSYETLVDILKEKSNVLKNYYTTVAKFCYWQYCRHEMTPRVSATWTCTDILEVRKGAAHSHRNVCTPLPPKKYMDKNKVIEKNNLYRTLHASVTH